MPLQPVNYAGIPVREPNYDFLTNLFENVNKGRQLKEDIGNMQRARQRDVITTENFGPTQAAALMKAELDNVAQQWKNREAEDTSKFKGPQAEATLKKTEADTFKLLHPEFSSTLTGPAAESFSIERLRRQAEKTKDPHDKETYERALRVAGVKVANMESIHSYRQHLDQTLDFRNASPIAKANYETNLINQSIDPISKERMSPERQAVVARIENGVIQRMSGNQKAAALLPYAENLDITIDSIDPKALASGSGAWNSAWRSGQQLALPFGKESDNYRKYLENRKKLTFVIKQLRQMGSDSVQPAMLDKLEGISNEPGFWSNPKLVEETFNNFKGLVKQETSTIHRLLPSPAHVMSAMTQPQSGMEGQANPTAPVQFKAKIDPKAITQFAGMEGTKKLFAARRDADAGKASKSYDAYNQSATAAMAAAKDYLITHPNLKKDEKDDFKKLSSPATWEEHPDMAINMFKKYQETLANTAKAKSPKVNKELTFNLATRKWE